MAERHDLGFLFDERYMLHNPGARHPESPMRLLAVRDALDDLRIDKRWRKVEARPARIEEVELVHSAAHIERLERAAANAPTYLDPDTMVSAESHRIALLAAGGVIECVDAICGGRLRRAFAFVRPPGHHAEPERAMGFCLLNNVAIAAAHARRFHKLERIAVIDFDVHHGNGTQVCFYDDPHVLYLSSHQFPLYPGTGNFDEIGTGEGRGYTVNFPMPQGTGDGTFVPLYSRIVRAILDQYRPQLLLASAGFDAHFRDPLAALIVTNAAFSSIAASLILAADEHCSGRICFVLEGGYSAEALRDCTRGVLSQMESEKPAEMVTAVNPVFQQISEGAGAALGSFWRW